MLGPLEALEDRTAPAVNLDGIWDYLAQGPGPIVGGQSDAYHDDQVIGAIEAVAVDPNNAARIFVGSVNGGIFRTTNATDIDAFLVPSPEARPLGGADRPVPQRVRSFAHVPAGQQQRAVRRRRGDQQP